MDLSSITQVFLRTTGKINYIYFNGMEFISGSQSLLSLSKVCALHSSKVQQTNGGVV